MVKVIFYNLLRSKYGVKEEDVRPGTIHNIIDQILSKHPEMKLSDYQTSIVFHQGTPIHYGSFNTIIEDNETIIITHFVGGG